MGDTGLVFNIQRFSIHDGPGIRTTVFLKGCSLRCFWCHNPEGLRATPEILFSPDRCIGDGECAAVCPQHAHEFDGKLHIYHRDLCTACGQCVDVCYAEALEISGRKMTVDQVVAEVLQDRAFYETSGGGVTLSGGDPLVQRAFSRAILFRCKAEGLHTALETAANCRWQDLESLLPVTDLMMMDLKQMDPEKHRAATGVSNQRILANARRLAELGVSLIFRVPVVPTVNDTVESIAAIAGFVRDLTALGKARGHYASDRPSLELLPFHRMAGNKYERLGMEHRARDLQPPGKDIMANLTEVASSCGIPVRHR